MGEIRDHLVFGNAHLGDRPKGEQASPPPMPDERRGVRLQRRL